MVFKMKLGLLGDIHGNIDALSAVLNKARETKIDILLVTGDLVGYYFSPAKVLQILSKWPKYMVRGNHEDMLIAARKDRNQLSTIGIKYGSGIQIALDELSKNQLDELCGLPHPLELLIDGCRILLCHGSPDSVDQYVYPDVNQMVIESFDSKNYDFVIMGHTHYPMRRQVNDMLLINPGSVGQPRDGRPGAQWAVLDTISGEVEFRVEAYDRQNLLKKCRNLHPDLPYLGSILERSK
jgi:putative phosphoesterase